MYSCAYDWLEVFSEWTGIECSIATVKPKELPVYIFSIKKRSWMEKRISRPSMKVYLVFFSVNYFVPLYFSGLLESSEYNLINGMRRSFRNIVLV